MRRRDARLAPLLALAGALAVALAGAVAPARAQKQAPPAPGIPKDLALPAIRRFSLDNGMAVTLVPSGGAVPKVMIGLAIGGGTVDERDDERGAAELVGQLLLAGSRTRDADQLARAAAAMGGWLDASVGADETFLSIDVLEDQLEGGLEMIADLAIAPALPAPDLARAKADRQRVQAIAIARPGARVEERARALLYAGHRYARPAPASEALGGLSIERVRAFHARAFVPAAARLFVVGRFDPGRAEVAIRARFGGWRPAGPAIEAVPGEASVPPPPAGPRIVLIDRPGAAQSVVHLSIRAIAPSDRDYVALEVADAMLGGALWSRIPANLRERRGYAYVPRSGLVAQARGGHWYVRADVRTDVTGPALREIFHELDALASAPPTASELAATQAYLAGRFVRGTATRWELLEQLRAAMRVGTGDLSIGSYVRRVHAVTAADVQRVVAAHLARARMHVIVEGDAAIIEPQLRAIGPVVR